MHDGILQNICKHIALVPHQLSQRKKNKKKSGLFSVALFEQISNTEFMQMFNNYVVLDDEFVKCHFL